MKTNYKYIRKINSLFRSLAFTIIILISNSSFADDLPNATTLVANNKMCTAGFPENLNPVIDGVKGNKLIETLATILATALIEEGVDFIGDRLAEAAMPEILTVVASENIQVEDFKGTEGKLCLNFSHGKEIQLLIDLNGAKDIDNNTVFMIPTLRSLKYINTIEGKRKKSRGLMIQLDVQSPLSTTAVTQTLNLGNVNSADNVYDGAEGKGLQREFRVMSNPFQSIEESDKEKININLPLIFTVSLIEMRDANVALQLLADTSSNANDDLTRAIIEIVVPENNDGG